MHYHTILKHRLISTGRGALRPLVALLLLVLLSAGGYLFVEPASPVSHDLQDDPDITSWLSKKEAARLMQYHGVQGLKITDAEVFIVRDGRWIRVYHDPPYPTEKNIASGSPEETLLASAERS